MSEKLEVIFLGTGGGVPGPRRYLPAVALRRGGEWFLMDAGEGVQMRLRDSPLGWGGLRAIFISHLHGDHILGLPGLLMSIGMNGIRAPLAIYGPPGLQSWVEATLATCRVQLPVPLIIHAIEKAGGILLEGADFVVEAFPVHHRIPCWGFTWREQSRPGRFYPERAVELGVSAGPLYGALQAGQSVTLPDGRVIQPADVLGPARPGRVVAYCTDTLPCAAVETAAQGADLLIHDSTFAAGMEDEARISGHSTAEQAANLARRAGCRRLALTHISVRYEDPGEMEAQARAIFPESFVAADLQQVIIPTREV